MTSVQEEVSALAQRWSEWSQLHDGDNGVNKDDSGVAELEESYQDPEAQFNIAPTLLDMDERELADPLRRAREWIQNQAKSIEKNKAWTKKETIHILVLAQQAEKLEPFFEKPGNKEGHQTKKLLKDILDLGCTYLEVLNNVNFSKVIL
ncbi:hypothetical protein V6N13_003366 [Hibiscus sabdariffa]